MFEENKIEKWKERIGNFLKISFFFFLILFLILGWSQFREIFDYRSVYQEWFQAIKEEEDKKNSEGQEGEIFSWLVHLEQYPYAEKNNFLEIPRLAIEAPIVFGESSDKESLEKALKKGVVHYPPSVLPAQPGQTIILGHSAPPGWPKKDYDGVFSRLNELEAGDKIYLYFQHRQLPYQMKEKFFLTKGEEFPTYELTNSANVLILISCWPPGIDQKRIAIRAELLSSF